MNEETEEPMEEDDAREVVYVTEYGAAVPAWVELDTRRWMARHWLVPVVMMAGDWLRCAQISPG